MNIRARGSFAIVALCAVLATSTRAAKAESLGADVAWVGVGIGLAGAAIATGIILAIKHRPSITGCVVQHESSLLLKDDSDGKSYVLHGDTALVTPGQRVRVSGRQSKRADPPEFDVEKLKKTLGTCSAP